MSSRSKYSIKEISDSHHRNKSSSVNTGIDDVLRKLNRLTKTVDSIDDRLRKLELESKDTSAIRADVNELKTQMSINDYAINADSHLNQYLMEVKEQEAIEMAVTDRDIEKGSKKINSKRSNRR